MIYNDQQFAELAKWDEALYFVKASGTLSPRLGMHFTDVQRLAQIHREATGSKLRPASHCDTCMARVLRVIGTYYFADKEARQARQELQEARRELQEAAARKVEKTEETAAPVKATVKTAAKPKSTAKKATKSKK